MTTHILRRAWARVAIVHQRSDVRFVRVSPRLATVLGNILDRPLSVSASPRRTVAALTARVAPHPDARAR
jgi:hypothetical protein